MAGRAGPLAGLLACAVLLLSVLPSAAGQQLYARLDNNTFPSFVTGSRPVLVEFFSPICGPCRRFQPDFEKVAEALQDSGIGVAQIDALANFQLFMSFNLSAVPTVMMFPRGWTKAVNPVIFSSDSLMDAISVLQFALDFLGACRASQPLLSLTPGTPTVPISQPEVVNKTLSFVTAKLASVEQMARDMASFIAISTNQINLNDFASTRQGLWNLYQNYVRANTLALGVFYADSRGSIVGYIYRPQLALDATYFSTLTNSSRLVLRYYYVDPQTGSLPPDLSMVAAADTDYLYTSQPWFPIAQSGALGYTPLAVYPPFISPDVQSWLMIPVAQGPTTGWLGIDLSFSVMSLRMRVLKALSQSEVFMTDVGYRIIGASIMEEAYPQYPTEPKREFPQAYLVPLALAGKNAFNSSVYGAAAAEVSSQFASFTATTQLSPSPLSFKLASGSQQSGQVALASNPRLRLVVTGFAAATPTRSTMSTLALVGIIVLVSLLGVIAAVVGVGIFLTFRAKQPVDAAYSYFPDQETQPEDGHTPIPYSVT
jgi:thiol-disulfide isomerase/thioredoxin